MDDNKALIDLENPESIIKFLQAPTLNASQFLTGFFSSAPTRWIKSAGHLVQGWIACKFFEQFGQELKEYIEKGKVKKDFFSTGAQQASLRELLKFIDEGTDEERFKAMKSIFFAAISKDATEADEILAYELMQVAKQLNSNDIMVLKATYNIGNKNSPTYKGVELANGGDHLWRKLVVDGSGHKMDELVMLSEHRLIGFRIMTGPRYADGSGITSPETARLTPLGLKLCEFITAYQ